MNCPFCEIVARDGTPLEGSLVIAFPPLRPHAASHLIIAPRRHVELLSGCDEALLAAILAAAHQEAGRLGLRGFRVQINQGASEGQTVTHLHAHLLSRQPSGASPGTGPGRRRRDRRARP